MFTHEVKAALQKIRIRDSTVAKKQQLMPESEPLRDLATNMIESNKEDDLLSSNAENRFFADSPYYDMFVEKEMHSAEILSTTLKDIGTETASFSRAKEILLKSLNSLSSSCRQCSNNVQQGKKQTSVELAPEIEILQGLAETLEEISAAHKSMFDMIESFLGYHLMELSVKQTSVIEKLKKRKKEAEIQTRHSEQEIYKYLNGKNTPVGRSFLHSQNICVEEATAELKRFQLVKNIVDAKYERQFDLNRSQGEVLLSMHNCFRTCLDKVDSMIPKVDKNQEQHADYQKTKQPLWEEQEKSLIQILPLKARIGESDDAHIWDLPRQLARITNFHRLCPQDVLMEGWLYQKCSPMMSLQSSRVRKWFVLKSDGIYYLELSNVEGCKSSENKIFSTKKVEIKLFDILLCTVRELPAKPSARFCFELIDSSNKTISLQAKGPKEYQMWLDSIRFAVGSQLARVNPQVQKGNFGGDSENPLITQILKANPQCADCGAHSPDWVSLNLGILMCLECSGVHRSLGCHVSKVRSLTLDTLSDGEASLLLSLGNDRVNKIWEQEMKPCNRNFQDRAAREDMIKRKYVKKEFMGSSRDLSADLEEELSRELYAASGKGDVIGVATALAHGAKLDWKNADKGGAYTALGLSLKRADGGENGASECTQLLRQCGARAA